MNEKTLIEVLDMSGYAAYVWSCFGLTAVLLLTCYIYTKKQQKKVIKESKMLLEQLKLSKDN